GVGVTVHLLPSQCSARFKVASGLLPVASGTKFPTAQMLLGPVAAAAPRLLSSVPSCGARTTCQPPEESVLLVNSTGSFGVGVGTGRSGGVMTWVAMGAVPATAKSGAIGFTLAVSHVNSRQPRPKDI